MDRGRNKHKLTDIPDKAIGYLMYLLTVLNYDTVDQTTFLPFRGWYRDTDKEFDTKAAGNVGFALRQALFNQSATERISIPLTSLPFLDFQKAIPPHLELMLRFHPAATTDCLIGDHTKPEAVAAKLEIIDPQINYSLMVLDPDAEAKMNAMVTKGGFVINDMDSWSIKLQPLRNDLLKNRLENVFTGVLPKCIIIRLQKNAQVQGAFSSNPYRFESHDLERIEIEGDAGYYDLDMRDYKQSDGYMSFIKGRKDSGKGIEISYTQWKDDYCLYIIDLTPRQDYTDTVRSPDIVGDLSIVFHFPTGSAPTDLQALLFGQKNNTLAVDSLKSIFVENL